MATFTGTIGADIISGTSGDDIISGLDGNDSLSGGDGNDSIDGGDGNDWIDGGKGSDTLIGGAGDDTIIGSGDDDTIIGGSGNDSIQGTNGADTIQYSGNGNGYDAVDGGTSILDKIVALSTNTVIGLTSVLNVETVDGFSDGTTAIKGSTGADNLNFSTTILNNIAYIDGGDGDDTITGSTSADTIRGNAGNDTLVGNNAADIFQYAGTTDGFDSVDGSGGNDRILALSNNTMIGLSSISSVETIDANSKSGVWIGGGADANAFDFSSVTLIGIASITGGDGDDTITGSIASDTIAGGDGNDLIYVGASAGADALDGGAGTDTISAISDNTAITVTSLSNIEVITAAAHTGVSLAGSSGADNINISGATLVGIGAIDLGDGNDSFEGWSGSDTILSSQGNDTVSGGAGNDVYQYAGSTGFDALEDLLGSNTILVTADNTILGFSTLSGISYIDFGGHSGISMKGTNSGNHLDIANHQGNVGIVIDARGGDDTLTGGGPLDTIIGGAGKDTMDVNGTFSYVTFAFDDGDSIFGASDLITDLTTTNTIDLSAIDADSTMVGDQAFVIVGTSFTHHAGELIFTTSGSYSALQGDTNGDGVPDFELDYSGTINSGSIEL